MTEIRFTPAARSQLLETVAELRGRNRNRATRLVERMIDALLDVADEEDSDRELVVSEAAAAKEGGHRFYTRNRGDILWVIALWPEREPMVERQKRELRTPPEVFHSRRRR